MSDAPKKSPSPAETILGHPAKPPDEDPPAQTVLAQGVDFRAPLPEDSATDFSDTVLDDSALHAIGSSRRGERQIELTDSELGVLAALEYSASVRPPHSAASRPDATALGETVDDLTSQAVAAPTLRTVLPRVNLQASEPTLVVDARKRYEPKEALGAGAAGEVELALDNDINRLVAIKRLKKDLHIPAHVARFVEEVQTIGRLEHPNIAPIHDVGKDENDQYYFVMKYVEGDTLKEIIDKLQAGDPRYHQKYSIEYRTHVFMEILKAVEFSHHHSVIHRDLKPENVIVGEYGEVMVMDWGIAKRIGAPSTQLESAEASSDDVPEVERVFQTLADSLVGTPLYMAPEQARGENDRLDERTDLYSLCVLFYELLTLRHPLGDRKTLRDVLRGVVNDKARLAMMVRHPHQPPVPADLSHVLAKGLAKSPDDRFQSAAEVRERLQKIQEGYLPVQCPFTLTKRSVYSLIHLVDKRPMLSLMLMMLFVILLIGGGVFFATVLTG